MKNQVSRFQLTRQSYRDLTQDISYWKNQGATQEQTAEMLTGDYRLSKKQADQITSRYYKPRSN